MDESARNENGFAKGFLFGIFIGVVLTLLLTTKKGQRMLSALRGRGGNFLDELADAANDVREKVEDLKEKVEDVKEARVSELVSDVQERGRAVAKTALKKISKPSGQKRRTFIRRKAS